MRAEFLAFTFDQAVRAKDAPPTILVCEDDAPLRTLVEFMLSGTGYRLLVAAGGEQALQLAGTVDEISVLVTDLHMQEMSGLDLIRELEKRFPALKVVVVSGEPPDAMRDLAPASDYAYVRKPFDEDSLRAAIARVLESS
jgi:CheY-like chemotaxis protein